MTRKQPTLTQKYIDGLKGKIAQAERQIDGLQNQVKAFKAAIEVMEVTEASSRPLAQRRKSLDHNSLGK